MSAAAAFDAWPPDFAMEHVLVVASGAIDLDTVEDLQEQLGLALGLPAPVVILDASAVTFMDCSGLRELVSARARLAARGGQFYLKDPSPAVQRLLEYSGTTDHFGVSDPGEGVFSPREVALPAEVADDSDRDIAPAMLPVPIRGRRGAPQHSGALPSPSA